MTPYIALHPEPAKRLTYPDNPRTTKSLTKLEGGHPYQEEEVDLSQCVGVTSRKSQVDVSADMQPARCF